jgi:hypothetical protein
MWAVAWAFIKRGGWKLLIVLGALIPVAGWWLERRNHKSTKRDLGAERVRRQAAEVKGEDHRLRAGTARELADLALKARDQERADRIRIHDAYQAERDRIESLRNALEEMAAKEGAARAISDAFDLPTDED